MTVAAIVPAAGRGERLGPGATQGAAPPGRRADARPRGTDPLARARSVDLVVVAAPEDSLDVVRTLLLDHEVGASVQAVAGGATRQESVGRALSSLPADVDVVLVHDAARPLVPPELVDTVARRVRARRGRGCARAAR